MEYNKDYTICAKFKDGNVVGTHMVLKDEYLSSLGDFLDKVFESPCNNAFDEYLKEVSAGGDDFISLPDMFEGFLFWENGNEITVIETDPDPSQIFSSFNMDVNELIELKKESEEKRLEFINSGCWLPFIPAEVNIEKTRQYMREKYDDYNYKDEYLSYIFPVFITSEGMIVKEYYMHCYTLYFGDTSDGEYWFYFYDPKTKEEKVVCCGFRYCYPQAFHPITETDITYEQLKKINKMFNAISYQKNIDIESTDFLLGILNDYLKEEIFPELYYDYVEKKLKSELGL